MFARVGSECRYQCNGRKGRATVQKSQVEENLAYSGNFSRKCSFRLPKWYPIRVECLPKLTGRHITKVFPIVSAKPPLPGLTPHPATLKPAGEMNLAERSNFPFGRSRRACYSTVTNFIDHPAFDLPSGGK
jgi:hypothetical protein